jgi:hypothetical protein
MSLQAILSTETVSLNISSADSVSSEFVCSLAALGLGIGTPSSVIAELTASPVIFNPPTWEESTAYEVGDVVFYNYTPPPPPPHPTPISMYLVCNTPGTSSATYSLAGAALYSQVTDGTVTWTVVANTDNPSVYASIKDGNLHVKFSRALIGTQTIVDPFGNVLTFDSPLYTVSLTFTYGD